MSHTCHAMRCKTACRPTLLMCPKHWRMVPVRLQRLVLTTYRRGQCDDKRPSLAWHEAADAAIAAVALAEGCPPGNLRVCQVRAVLSHMPSLLGENEAVMRAQLAALDATEEAEA